MRGRAMWRQGDIFIEPVETIPDHSKQTPLPTGTLVHGELTGHSHRIDDLSAASLFAGNHPGEIYVEVSGSAARIVHEEHGPIELPRGVYRVWRQREYSPQAIRLVVD